MSQSSSSATYQSAHPDALKAKFKSLSEEYARLLNSIGVQTKPYDDPSLPIFEAASRAMKKQAVEYLEHNSNILRECLSAGEDPRKSAQLLWRSLREMNLVPESDIFDKIENDDMVEIYAKDGKQLFRNIWFFEVTTYTLEMILCGLWYKYCRRPWRIFLQAFKQAVRLRMGQIVFTEKWTIPTHYLDELNTEGLIRFEYTFRYRSPVRRKGEIIGMIMISKCFPVGSHGQIRNKEHR